MSCAASLSAIPGPEQATIARNQFYIIEFNPIVAAELGLGVAARFKSWEWVAARGWISSRQGSGLPAEGGFGFRANMPDLCGRILGELSDARSRGLRRLDWDQVTILVPVIDYMTPNDQDVLTVSLRNAGALLSLDADSNVPRQIALAE